ncbi:nicotianamine synthase-like [Cicer arietinum]|uniref:Nicotianamine synthase n=1 Tax=Cicer arietinum TaxID=3827 RepID=A0A1S2XU86_CICAR|nr:nicotianamine synthase-like [Cicer arietinum]
MVCQEDLLIEKVCDLYEQISSLESLKPCKNVDMLFTELVLTCMPPSPIDVTNLPKNIQEKRSHLIRLCGEAEGYLERHYSSILGSYQNPLQHLHIFPYYSNYLKLGLLEFSILSQHSTHVPNKIAFIGSGPLPLTSIVLASNHLPSTTFHNYDIDPLANSSAMHLVSSDPDLSNRMVFHTNDILDVSNDLKDYEVVYLAALVGMDNIEKNRIIDHLGKHMAPGSLLMLRSAHGARAFLYPVVEPSDLRDFEVISVFHPMDEVINSIVISRKYSMPIRPLDQGLGSMILPNKCSEIQVFNPLMGLNHGNMIEELTINED